jgi:protease-4
VLPLARLLLNALVLLGWPLWALLRRARLRRVRWVALRLGGRVVQLESPRPALFRDLLSGFRPRRTSVAAVRQLRKRLADDPHVQGLLVYVGHLEGGWATLTALRSELAAVRASGKQIVAYLPLGASQREIFVASVADRVFSAPEASFSALGPMVARVYLASLLRRLGVRVEVMAEGPYKTAAEPLIRETMSEPEREQLTAIVGTLAEGWVQGVAERPKLGEAGARALLDTAYFGAPHAAAIGLVDGTCYEDELPALLGLPERNRPMESRRYVRASRPRALLPLRPEPRLAVVRFEGVITERPSGRSVALGAATSCLRAVAEHPRVAGVVLYIDSPGGSAEVSDLLHREVRQLDAKKPVVAWLGNVAASGGYYLAAGTRRIVASPQTLTGSIGVISARPTAAELFAKLALHQEVVKLTPHADLHSPTRELTERERELLQAEAHRFYMRFLEVVASGRKRPREAIEALAGGRVWSGRDAFEHGLVDELGGFPEARAALERELGEQAASLARDPLVISLPRKDVTPLAPARAALASLDPSLETALDMWELCRNQHLLLLAPELLRGP